VSLSLIYLEIADGSFDRDFVTVIRNVNVADDQPGERQSEENEDHQAAA
jgi:hypothetical protein